MKNVVLAVVLACVGGSSAYAGPLDFITPVIEDIKTNTALQVESAIPYAAVDWKRGEWAAGSAVPFFHIGSYLYFAGALSKDLSGDTGRAELLNGIRLNKLTRPLAVKALNAVTFGNLDKVSFLEYLAEATSVGVTAGHDFSYAEKKRVVINSSEAFSDPVSIK